MPNDTHTSTLLGGIILLALLAIATFILFKFIEYVVKEVGPAMVKSILFLGIICLAFYFFAPKKAEQALINIGIKPEQSTQPRYEHISQSNKLDI